MRTIGTVEVAARTRMLPAMRRESTILIVASMIVGLAGAQMGCSKPASPTEPASTASSAEVPGEAEASPSLQNDSTTGAASQPDRKVSAHGGGERGGGIQYASACPGREPCVCRGNLRFGHNALLKIGVSRKTLSSGTLCIIADFDGNGVDDLAFVDDKYKDPQVAARVAVLMFDRIGLMATTMLPKRVLRLGWAPTEDDRIALVEPELTEGQYRFMYRDGRFEFERIPK